MVPLLNIIFLQLNATIPDVQTPIPHKIQHTLTKICLHGNQKFYMILMLNVMSMLNDIMRSQAVMYT